MRLRTRRRRSARWRRHRLDVLQIHMQHSIHASRDLKLLARVHHQMLTELEELERERDSNLPPI